MYQVNTCNFFYLNSKIAVSSFFYLAYINNISNIDWLQLRFSSINKYELSFFLFTTRSLKNNYINIPFYNKCIALFSKYYNYFFTNKIMNDNFLFLESDYVQIKIQYYAFYFLQKIIYLSNFLYYKRFNIIDTLKPFYTNYTYPYLTICKYEYSFYKMYYFFELYLYYMIVMLCSSSLNKYLSLMR